jgi:hypothetical protein
MMAVVRNRMGVKSVQIILVIIAQNIRKTQVASAIVLIDAMESMIVHVRMPAVQFMLKWEFAFLRSANSLKMTTRVGQLARVPSNLWMSGNVDSILMQF